MKCLSPKDQQTLYNHLKTSLDHKDVLLQILFETGCRIGEALRLTPGHLTAETQTLRIDPLKRSELRRVTISQNLTSKLARYERPLRYYLGETVRPDSLRRSLARHLSRTLQNLSIPDTNLHTLRHTAITRLYVATKDLILTKQWAGHRSINSTMCYMHADLKAQANEKASDLLKNLAG